MRRKSVPFLRIQLTIVKNSGIVIHPIIKNTTFVLAKDSRQRRGATCERRSTANGRGWGLQVVLHPAFFFAQGSKSA